MESKQQTINHPDYFKQLLDLGVPAELLATELIDYERLYNNLFSQRRLSHPMQCTEKWQILALGGKGHHFAKLAKYLDKKDDCGRGPFHYAAYTGEIAVINLIQSFWPENLFLKDNTNVTPLAYAAMSGNVEIFTRIFCLEHPQLTENEKINLYSFTLLSGKPEILDHINLNFPEIFKQMVINGIKPATLITQSGNVLGLDWLKQKNPIVFLERDENDLNLLHTAVMTNPEVLDWIKKHYPEEFLKRNRDGLTLLHTGALSGNPLVVDWFIRNYPQKFRTKDDNRGIPPLTYAFLSGKPNILDVLNKHYHLDKVPMQSLTCVAMSGKPEALNHMYSLCHYPESWTLDSRFKDSSELIIKTIVEALKTNYTITSIDFNDFTVDEISKASIHASLLRNINLKLNKQRYLTFLEGLFQPNSIVSSLNIGNVNLYTQILNSMLPETLDASSVLDELLLKTDPALRAVVLIDKEMELIKSSYIKKSKKFHLFKHEINFKLDLEDFAAFDPRIALLLKMKSLVETETTDLAAKIKDWENSAEYQILYTEQKKSDAKWSTRPLAQTLDAICKIKEVLGLKTELVEVDGFVFM